MYRTKSCVEGVSKFGGILKINMSGWDTYKQVFRSYKDPDFTPKRYRNTGQNTWGRDFFDRIEHFSGKPGVLRTLPDNGAIYDKFLSDKALGITSVTDITR